MRRCCYLRTGDVLNQLSNRCVVRERASCRLHVWQLRDKLLNFSHSFGIVAFLKDRKVNSLTQSLVLISRIEYMYLYGSHMLVLFYSTHRVIAMMCNTAILT